MRIGVFKTYLCACFVYSATRDAGDPPQSTSESRVLAVCESRPFHAFLENFPHSFDRVKETISYLKESITYFYSFVSSNEDYINLLNESDFSLSVFEENCNSINSVFTSFEKIGNIKTGMIVLKSTSSAELLFDAKK